MRRPIAAERATRRFCPKSARAGLPADTRRGEMPSPWRSSPRISRAHSIEADDHRIATDWPRPHHRRFLRRQNAHHTPRPVSIAPSPVELLGSMRFRSTAGWRGGRGWRVMGNSGGSAGEGARKSQGGPRFESWPKSTTPPDGGMGSQEGVASREIARHPQSPRQNPEKGISLVCWTCIAASKRAKRRKAIPQARKDHAHTARNGRSQGPRHGWMGGDVSFA